MLCSINVYVLVFLRFFVLIKSRADFIWLYILLFSHFMVHMVISM
ncbi:hypothetical protein ymoll0001_22180 [Yersinia mollaretii ATCC 43969]|uniref:Uncharacterized protein n=1 Tax=Yersinia mollaretii (strain ATCC 43969 / DSM 18520 / CIP 103324 / CNY 7263 / WAIP 204) TaxID=349967 RepID=A0ABM9YCG5_YERMW|nr:hypothetical protein ymoll0001_22180 [Yersinia mollaretii ATCC 43969]